MSSRRRTFLVAAGMVASLTLALGGGCDRLRGRAPAPGEPAAPSAESPAEGASAPPQASSGPVTPKTQAPNEARVLSSAFSAVAKALRPSVVRIDIEIQEDR